MSPGSLCSTMYSWEFERTVGVYDSMHVCRSENEEITDTAIRVET